MKVCPQCSAPMPPGSAQCPRCHAAITDVEQSALDLLADVERAPGQEPAAPPLAAPGSLGARWERALTLPGGKRRARAALSAALVALALLASVAAWQGFVHSPWGALLRGMNQIVFVGIQRADFSAISVGDFSVAGCQAVSISGTPEQVVSYRWQTPWCSSVRLSRLAGAVDPAALPQLYTMRPDGSGVRRLTNHADEYYFSPAWSPDGAHIAAFGGSASRSSVAHVVVMDADGSNPHQIPAIALRTDIFMQPAGAGLSPSSRLVSWSPDGRQLVAPVGVGRYALVNADGSSPRLFNGFLPVWSPDGRYLAYYVSDPDNQDVSQSFDRPAYTLELLDTQTFQTRQPGHLPALNAEALAWSPDGRFLAASAFQAGRYRSEPLDSVLLVPLDGSRPKMLARWVSGRVQQIAWSPDSLKFAVVLGLSNTYRIGAGEPSVGSDLWVVNTDGSNAREIGPSDDGQPSWSPDGKRLVYASADDSELIVAETSAQPKPAVQSLSLSLAFLAAPCWSPLGG